MSENGRWDRSPMARGCDPVASRWEWVTRRACDVGALRRHVGLSEGAWAEVVAHGGIFVNSRRVVAGEVPAGAFVRVYHLRVAPVLPALDEGCVLFEGGGLVVIDKPAWWSTVPTRASARLCVEAALREPLGMPGLVAAHRLDKQTSGVLVLAADGRVAARVHDLFRRRAVEKTYLAVTAPPTPVRWTVQGRIVRVGQVKYSRYALVDGDGDHSHTEFERLAVEGGRALVRARPRTGRTHQIRVHLAHGRTPIVGDTVYGPPWRAGAPWSADRTQLHAERIRFAWDGRELEIRAPVPADFVMRP